MAVNFYNAAKAITTQLLTNFGTTITLHKQINTGTDFNPTISEENVQIVGVIKALQANTQLDIQHGDLLIITNHAVEIDDTMTVSFSISSANETTSYSHAKIVNVETTAPNGLTITQKIQIRTWLNT